MVYEGTPGMPKVRATKAQIKKMQKSMQQAGKISKKLKPLEDLEKEMAEEELKKLDEIV